METAKVTDQDMRDARLKKLSFRAWRRGFKEADIILGNFADDNLALLSDEELDIFEILLEAPDHDLYGWIIERDPTPAEFQSVIMNKLNYYYKIAHTKI